MSTVKIARKVKFSLTYVDNLKDENGAPIYGITDDREGTIKLDSALKPGTKLHDSTLFHEWLHAVIGVTGWTAMLGSEPVEEGFVTMLETHLYPLLDKNRLTALVK